MATTPFFEGSNPSDRRRITFLSNSIDTSEVDPFRQGVELTQAKHFQQGIAKIWSGVPGHAIEMVEIGQNDDEIFPEHRHYEEVERFNPVLYLTDFYTNQVVVIDSAVSMNESTFDGIIEPLTIRRVISFTSIESPFESHSVKGNLESGNWNPFHNSDQLISKYDITEINLGTNFYEDNADMTGQIPTNIGFWPALTTRVKAFDDSRTPDGTMISSRALEDMKEALKSMDPATDNYLPENFVSSAALLTNYSDWIHVTNFEAPRINSLNYSQGDVGGGGERIVLTGTGFSRATNVLFGSTPSVFDVVSNTQISAVLPAGSAGDTSIVVIGPGGTSNSYAFEYWSPAQLSPVHWLRAPNYTDTPSGVWTDEGSLLDNFVEVTNFPTAGAALGTYASTADFDGVNDILQSTTNVNSTITGADFFIWCLFNGDVAGVDPTTYNGNLIADYTNAELGIEWSTSGVAGTILEGAAVYQSSAFIAAPAATWNLVMMQCDSSSVGSEGMIALNDSSWTTWSVTGGYGPAAPGPFGLGRSFENKFFDGKQAEIGVVNSTISAINVTKLRKYMEQRYGVDV